MWPENLGMKWSRSLKTHFGKFLLQLINNYLAAGCFHQFHHHSHQWLIIFHSAILDGNTIHCNSNIKIGGRGHITAHHNKTIFIFVTFASVLFVSDQPHFGMKTDKSIIRFKIPDILIQETHQLGIFAFGTDVILMDKDKHPIFNLAQRVKHVHTQVVEPLFYLLGKVLALEQCQRNVHQHLKIQAVCCTDSPRSSPPLIGHQRLAIINSFVTPQNISHIHLLAI